MQDNLNSEPLSAAEEAMRKCVSILSEFGPCQVFLSFESPGDSTQGFARGSGNFYARVGLIKEWLDNGGALNPPEFALGDDEEE